MRFVVFGLLLMAGVGLLGATDAAAPVAAPVTVREATAAELSPWKTEMDSVRSQLNVLDLVSVASRFGPITINIPKELQKLPVAMIDKEGELAKRDIQIYLKSVTLQDAEFDKSGKDMWGDQAPLLPSLVRFKRLGITADAQTKLGRFPLGAMFKDGQMPFDFLVKKGGYDIGLMPERRKDDVHLDNVDLDVAGPLTNVLASKLAGKQIGKLLLTYGMGQTLKMDKGGLLPDSVMGLPGVKAGAAETGVVNSLVDMLKK